jgi:putative integral membrane protein (TIGR02587 family)
MSAGQPNVWRAEGIDVVRAVSGGLLFGVPLLYTMEVWWTGTHTEPHQMLVLLALLAVPVFALNRTAGFRSSADSRRVDAVADSIETIAIGLVTTSLVLTLLREIDAESSVEVALGKTVYESIPFCLGIGFARHFLSGERADSTDEPSGGGHDPGSRSRVGGRTPGVLADLGASSLGAAFVALSIAPTDEVPLIASAMSPAWLLVMVAASLLASYGIVFVAGFTRQDARHAHQGAFQRPTTETVVCYLISLAVAFVLLWMFQRGVEPWTDVLNRVVVLGFPAAIGGAAGRLAV